MLSFTQNGINLLFDITENGYVILKDFSKNYVPDKRKNDHRWCNIAEVQICGKNPDDHHFGKHTGGYGTYTLKYSNHNHYKNELGDKLEFKLKSDLISAVVHYQLYDGIGAVRVWCEVTNISSENVGLEYVSAFSYTGFDNGTLPASEKIKVHIFLLHQM